jgi:SnoaL-like protein
LRRAAGHTKIVPRTTHSPERAKELERRVKMRNFEQLASRYIETFNEADPARRRAALQELYTNDAAYVDPHHELTGPAQIDEFIAATQERFPGYRFTLGSPVDAHHDQARFNWNATAPGDTEPAYVGFDVIVADDGRVCNVYGFMDRAPAG